MMTNLRQRHVNLVIALIMLHLAAFSQDKKYVKKNLSWLPDSTVNASHTIQPAPPYWDMKSTAMPQGIMCRKEYQLEKKVGMAIKIRLGSYQESHRLEYGK